MTDHTTTSNSSSTHTRRRTFLLATGPIPAGRLSQNQSSRKSHMLDVMDLLGREGGAQGIEHGQHVDDFLHDGTAYRA